MFKHTEAEEAQMLALEAEAEYLDSLGRPDLDVEDRPYVSEQDVAEPHEPVAAFRDGALVLIPSTDDYLPVFVPGRV